MSELDKAAKRLDVAVRSGGTLDGNRADVVLVLMGRDVSLDRIAALEAENARLKNFGIELIQASLGFMEATFKLVPESDEKTNLMDGFNRVSSEFAAALAAWEAKP